MTTETYREAHERIWREHRHYGTSEVCYECHERLQEWTAQRDAARQAAAEASAAPAAAPTAAIAVTDTAHAAAGVVTGAVRKVTDAVPLSAADPARATPETLLAALDACTDDAAYSELVANAPRDVRRKLSLLLHRRQFLRIGTGPDAYAEFSRSLEAATDDAVYLALIDGALRDPKRGSAWVREWQWRMRATADDWRRRYLKAAGIDGYVEM